MMYCEGTRMKNQDMGTKNTEPQYVYVYFEQLTPGWFKVR